MPKVRFRASKDDPPAPEREDKQEPAENPVSDLPDEEKGATAAPSAAEHETEHEEVAGQGDLKFSFFSVINRTFGSK